MKDLSVKYRNIQESYARGMKGLKDTARKEILRALPDLRPVDIMTPLRHSDCVRVWVKADLDENLVTVSCGDVYGAGEVINWNDLDDSDWMNIYRNLFLEY